MRWREVWRARKWVMFERRCDSCFEIHTRLFTVNGASNKEGTTGLWSTQYTDRTHRVYETIPCDVGLCAEEGEPECCFSRPQTSTSSWYIATTNIEHEFRINSWWCRLLLIFRNVLFLLFSFIGFSHVLQTWTIPIKLQQAETNENLQKKINVPTFSNWSSNGCPIKIQGMKAKSKATDRLFIWSLVKIFSSSDDSS